MTKIELITYFENIDKKDRIEIGYDPKMSKKELLDLYNKEIQIPNGKDIIVEPEFITIRVLTQIYFVEDPSIYNEEKGNITYNVGDILTNVNSKYRERLEKHPTHVEILED